MEYYKHIAVVLVYWNSKDLEECIISMQDKIESLRIVVVVSAVFDNISMNEIRDVTY